MKVVNYKLLVISCILFICGCASAGELRRCQEEVRQIKGELQTMNQQINKLSVSDKETAKALNSIRFDMTVIRRELMAIKNPSEMSPSEEITTILNRLYEKESDLDKIAEELRIFGKQAIIALSLVLKQPDLGVRQRVEYVLQHMPPADVIAILSNSLKDPEIRLNAARILGELNDAAAVPVLAEYIKDSKPDFAFVISEALVKLKDKRGITGLIDALKSDNTSRRVLAYDLLTKLTHKDFSYKPYLSETERLKSVREWDEWWLKEGNDFNFEK